MPARARPMISVPATFEDEWPSGSALATECCMNLGVLVGGATGAMQALVDRHGVPSLAAFNVLAILEGAAMALPPSVIADRMLVSRATVTGVIDSLERRSLARRRPAQHDGRMRMVEATETGTAKVRGLLPDVHRLERDLMACLTPQEQRTLLRLVAKLQDHVRATMPGVVLKVPN